MSNGISISELLTHDTDSPNDIERISFRSIKPNLEIVDPDPTWPATYTIFASRIIAALGPPSSSSSSPTTTNDSHLISVSHVGSTSVPHLPAKATIDIDVVVPDIDDEDAYVPGLEAQGFQFLFRERRWYGHRFFTASEPMFANVHVWGPRCAEAERHRIFREWLVRDEGDRELYGRTKRECAERSREGGEGVQEYNGRKEGVLKEILGRAFKGFGLV